MTALFQTIFTILLAIASGWLGWRLNRADRRVYWVTVGISFMLILLIAAIWWGGNFAGIPGLAWLAAGQHRLIFFAVAAPMLELALLSKLKRRRERLLIACFLGLGILRVSVVPPLLAAVTVPELSRIKTEVDTRGICMQSTPYTCGPAAAVTILRRLGVHAEEGELGIAAGTNSVFGTEPEALAHAINICYGQQGVVAECRHFKSLDELRTAGPTVAVINIAAELDHYVAVFSINDRRVLTGDPAQGEHPFWKDEFLKVWRQVGVVIRRAGDSKR